MLCKHTSGYCKESHFFTRFAFIQIQKFIQTSKENSIDFRFYFLLVFLVYCKAASQVNSNKIDIIELLMISFNVNVVINITLLTLHFLISFSIETGYRLADYKSIIVSVD